MVKRIKSPIVLYIYIYRSETKWKRGNPAENRVFASDTCSIMLKKARYRLLCALLYMRRRLVFNSVDKKIGIYGAIDAKSGCLFLIRWTGEIHEMKKERKYRRFENRASVNSCDLTREVERVYDVLTTLLTSFSSRLVIQNKYKWYVYITNMKINYKI